MFIVGAGKAAIDVLQNIGHDDGWPGIEDERVVWVHRGHFSFTKREHMEGWMVSNWLLLRLLRSVLYYIFSLLCKYQLFSLLRIALAVSVLQMKIGSPSARIPFHGGVESVHILQAVRKRFLSRQRVLGIGNDAIRVDKDGVLQLICADDEVLNISSSDSVCFCTGQRRPSGSTIGSLLPSKNRDGVFTALPYSQVTPVNALITAGMLVHYFDGNQSQTAYSTGAVASKCQRLHDHMRNVSDNDPWAMALTFFGSAIISLQGIATPSVVGDFGFDYRWHHDWHRKDLDIRSDVIPLLS